MRDLTDLELATFARETRAAAADPDRLQESREAFIRIAEIAEEALFQRARQSQETRHAA